ncbi:MAG: small ribosomal subunit biogenesis GTPase RsgA [Candidatus Sedimenticola endophacoides]
MARRKLTQRQRERIGAIQDRRRRKLQERAEQVLEESDTRAPRPGLVITRHGQNLAVEEQHGGLIHCLFRQNIGHVVCGDRVVWQPTTPGEGVVTAIMERTTALVRPNFSGEEKPLAANISQLVVVLAPEPGPSRYLIDQYLVAAENIGVGAVLALNKRDLLDPQAQRRFLSAFGDYAHIGYPLVQISAREAAGLTPLHQLLHDHTSLLVGQSGVGKSSLINALLPDLNLQVGRLSRASRLGRHTTSATSLYHLPGGGRLIDSPGVRSFCFSRITRAQLEAGFREFTPYLGHCRFSDCAHDREPGCALRAALDTGAIHHQRLHNFLHMAEKLLPDR